MILKGSQRGNAAKLARHLMNVQDNEHVELHELRGFVSDEQLLDALLEAQAVAKGTRCQQHLFSLSLNPPEGERVDVATFEAAIELAEQRLGLDGHARAIVFHEKEGRRHAHAVWSRIDVETMTAKNLPFFKRRLMEVSKELYLQNGWDMPKGIVDQAVRNPLNFTRAEWQQAKRAMAEPSGLPWADDGCAGPKGPEWFGASLQQKEDEMTLVSRFEAASRSTAELHSLLAETFNAFAAAPRGSQERRDALQSMRNIEEELATRAPRL